MSIVVIKLITSEVVLADLIDDQVDHMVIERPLKVIQTPTPTNTPGEYVTLNVPVLYNPFGYQTKTTINKRDIVFYDLADDYYHLFHETCFSSLWDSEIKKQDMVLKLYAGEDEGGLDWGDDDSIIPEKDQHKTVGELFDEYEESLKKTLDIDTENEYNVVDGNETLH